ncbi:MAG: O-antigen ligase family protein [Candidatus Omnitrophica bacterium]|nr:O-antigen ligase family protein [Candidatus Omnitrophota bacterium]
MNSLAQAFSFDRLKHPLISVGFLTLTFAAVALKDGPLPKFILIAGTLAWGIFLFISALSRPEIALFSLTAYLPFSKQFPGDFGPFSAWINLTNLFILFVIFFCWLQNRKKGEALWISSPLNLPIFLFSGVAVVSILQGVLYGFGFMASTAAELMRRWLTPFLLYFLILNVASDRKTIRNLALIIMSVAVLVSLMALYDYLAEDDRIGGIANDPNLLAAFFNYYMFLPLGFFLCNLDRLKYWSALIPFLIFFRGIMVTFSRGGYFAFVCGLYAVTFFKNKLLFLLLLILSCLVFVNPTLLPRGIQYRLNQTFVKEPVSADQQNWEQVLDKSSRDRIRIWRGALQMIHEHPVTGIGFNLFQPKIQHYWSGTGPMDAHNTYLLIAAEMGIPALMVFLWMIWIVFWNTRLLYVASSDLFARGLALGFLGGIFSFFASNLYVNDLNSPEISSYFWILAALVMKLRILDAKERGT